MAMCSSGQEDAKKVAGRSPGPLALARNESDGYRSSPTGSTQMTLEIKSPQRPPSSLSSSSPPPSSTSSLSSSNVRGSVVKSLCKLWNVPEAAGTAGVLSQLKDMIPVLGKRKCGLKVADLMTSFDMFRNGMIGLVHERVNDSMKQFENARVCAVYAMHQVTLAEHKLLATKIIISCIYLEVMYEARSQGAHQNSLIASVEVLKEVLKNLHNDKVISRLIKVERHGGVRSWFSKKSRQCVLKSLHDMDVWVADSAMSGCTPCFQMCLNAV
eukprot:TRINITY_DN19904_c0_g1_i1.p1 TRINITY_DN19904_c0_g1~~TRINITY_DN19904_c0_g1_i1.p1  ORF type:complete len:270 (-),score=37.29 TRINITY_DN19904_c0_g1_i1:147-956(-)